MNFIEVKRFVQELIDECHPQNSNELDLKTQAQLWIEDIKQQYQKCNSCGGKQHLVINPEIDTNIICNSKTIWICESCGYWGDK